MNLETFLQSFTRNVESIIQWLFLFILGLSAFLISRGISKKKSGDGEAQAVAPAPVPEEIQGTLQQILERTSKLETMTVPESASPEAVAQVEAQIQSLKKELAEREEELKTAKEAASSAASPEEISKLTSRLKELEAKLAEYEILEDDIADLSLYKEENVRLRQELDKLKGRGGASAEPASEEAPPAEAASEPQAEEAPAPAPAATSEPTPEISGEDIVAEFAQAVSSETGIAAAEEPVPVAPTPNVKMEVPDTGNPMQDFEAAVEIERKMLDEKAPASSAGAASSGTPGEANDLFAEFTEPTGDDSTLDTDKMMAEMAALVNIEPTADNALEENIDTEKMASEASLLGQKQG